MAAASGLSETMTLDDDSGAHEGSDEDNGDDGYRIESHVCARDVLLIDEMSLITPCPNMLADIDCALKKATRCEHDFGNWLVILSGDFFQINDDVQYHNHTANGARCP